jgi:sugar phosphate isomerase/epimerase
MRIGVDGKKLPAGVQGPLAVLDSASELGMEGVFFRTVLDLSPTLDPSQLREVRAHADQLGLYLEAGIGKVNPFNTAETPEVRALGGGDYRRGVVRMLRACREIGCTELWACTASYQKQFTGLYAFDRFRTDVCWNDQLEATRRLLHGLAPTLHDLGCRLNLETHEEITTFELIRLVEQVGSDVVGITFDVGNVVVRGEDPLLAARRAAPFVHQSHLRDVVLFFVEDGLGRQVRPCGQGIVEWAEVIRALGTGNPTLNLSIEVHDPRHVMPIPIFDPAWQAAHPDLTPGELARLVELARLCEARVASGEMTVLPRLEGPVDSLSVAVPFVKQSAAYLRSVFSSS